MKIKAKSTLIALGLAALLLPAAVVWASSPSAEPLDDVAPLAGTPGTYNNADKVDWHHAGPSSGTTKQRKNNVLWAQSNGKLHWKAMPSAALNARYLNDDRQETISANVVNGSVLKVDNTGTGMNIYGLRASGEDRGVYGLSTSGRGVYGWSESGKGVYGYSIAGSGLYGYSVYNYGMTAYSSAGIPIKIVGVEADNLIEAWDYGAYPDNLRFKVTRSGHVRADGTFTSPAADLAEMLPAVGGLEPGDVLILRTDGKLTRSITSNSTGVTGVYSTNPGFLGGSSDDDDTAGKIPLAIAGVVPVKVSAENGPIVPGDLLTTSSTPGHAMKADQVEADGISFYLPGTIIGKALEPLEQGTGVISVLVTLQ
jgi:hypothetical protein